MTTTRTPTPPIRTLRPLRAVIPILLALVGAAAFVGCQPVPLVTCGGTNATIVGTDGNDVLDGTAGNDVIVGGAGNDTIDGKGGDDVICGDRNVRGNDTIQGGAGVDWVAFDEATTGGDLDLAAGTSVISGSDRLGGIENVRSGPQGDTIRGSSGANRVVLGRDDTVEGRAGNDVFQTVPGCLAPCPIYLSYAGAPAGVVVDAGFRTATGGAGTDTYDFDPAQIVGSNASDRLQCRTDARECNLEGRGGNDVLVGSTSADILDGGLGNDSLNGLAGNDRADFDGLATAVTVDLAKGTATGQGTDTLAAVEVVVGSTGADRLIGGAAACSLYGGRGADRLTAGPAGCGLYGGLDADTLTGGNGVDRMEGDEVGSTANDVVHAGGGNDVIVADLGNDLLDGGTGSDLVSFGRSGARVIVDLAAGLAQGGMGNDTLQQVEDVEGSPLGDDVRGSAGPNAFYGRAGGDVLAGLGGDDFLDGGDGDDSLYGDLGNDWVEGGRGIDNMGGGPDRDRLAFRTEPAAVHADLASGAALTSSGREVIAQFEDLMGSDFADTLLGTPGPNRISGAPGRDACDGRGGADAFVDCEAPVN